MSTQPPDPERVKLLEQIATETAYLTGHRKPEPGWGWRSANDPNRKLEDLLLRLDLFDTR